MKSQNSLTGKQLDWGEGDKHFFTFMITQQCNLACKYCYEINKNNKSVMSFEIAKKAIDYILDNFQHQSSVIWDFMGGEPLLEIDLIDQICDYIKSEIIRRNHPWVKACNFYISTNGLLYNTSKVQRFIKKHRKNLEIGISLDGNQAKHDLQRVKLDGTGSYQDVIKNVPLWMEQFPKATVKVTFASEDLPYLKDSIIHLWNLGLKDVPANVVYEDVWREGDEQIFEEQLMLLADYLLENKLWEEHTCSFFGDSIGYPLPDHHLSKNWCTSGEMIALDHQGNFYPCTRFLPFCMEKRQAINIGNVDDGIDLNKLRPFYALTVPTQSSQECVECEIARGCGWCQAFNYDQAASDTIYQRATYICKMHQARCRAYDYFWAKLRKMAVSKKIKSVAEEVRNQRFTRRKYLYLLLDDDAVVYCNYHKENNRQLMMTYETFKEGIDFARKNFWIPVLVQSEKELPEQFENEIQGIEVMRILPPNLAITDDLSIRVYDNSITKVVESDNSILLIDRKNISKMAPMVEELLKHTMRTNIVLRDVLNFTPKDYLAYGKVLSEMSNLLIDQYFRNGDQRELNVLTDVLLTDKLQSCNAGIDSLTLGPDGMLYLCPGFYYAQNSKIISGDLKTGFNIQNKHLLSIDKAPICSHCEAFQCRRCTLLNYYGTKEYNIPTYFQCEISHLECEQSLNLQKRLLELGLDNPFTKHKLDEIDYHDPLIVLKRKKALAR